VEREVIWTDPAWDDLDSAAGYIERDSAFYAAALVQEIKAAAASLAHFAERGQIVPEFGDESVRELLLGSYRLVYSISAEQIVILALVHGAQRKRRL
jgi:plasmid stabilization system protein ParE